jgi:AraC family transcriptional regulator
MKVEVWMVAHVHVSSDRSSRNTAVLLSSEIALKDGSSAATACLALSKEQRTRLGSVVRLLETAGQNLSRGDKEAYRCVAKATALLQAECELGAAGRRSAKRRDFLPAWKMTRIMSFIDANLDRPIRIEEMASIAKLSCSHFSRAFRATVGEPPSAVVIRRRVERAEQLILLTDKALSQIALECGMADQSHLTKLFRRSYGMSPGKWRRLQHGSEVVAGDHDEALPLACPPGLHHAIADGGGHRHKAAHAAT